MQGINKVILSGRLTGNFELRGKASTSGIAVNTYKDKTEFFNLVAFGGTAEYCVKYLRKGQTVIVEGSLSCNEYNDKKIYQVIVQNVSALGGGKDDDEKKSHEEEAEPNMELPDDLGDTDDLPF